MDLVAKIVNETLNIFTNSVMLDVWQGPEYGSVHVGRHPWTEKIETTSSDGCGQSVAEFARNNQSSHWIVLYG